MGEYYNFNMLLWAFKKYKNNVLHKTGTDLVEEYFFLGKRDKTGLAVIFRTETLKQEKQS